jgi:hypothetical protein
LNRRVFCGMDAFLRKIVEQCATLCYTIIAETADYSAKNRTKSGLLDRTSAMMAPREEAEG